MSRKYRCRVKKDLREVSRVMDEVEYKVSLLDILDKEEMDQEYRKTLQNLGAREVSDGKLAMDVEGVTVTIDPEERVAKARLADEREIVVRTDKEEDVYDSGDSRSRAQATLEAKADSEMRNKMAEEKRQHEHKIRKKLEDAQEAVKEKLREAANEAHKQALRKKANRMGRIITDQEDSMANGDKRLTIEIDLG